MTPKIIAYIGNTMGHTYSVTPKYSNMMKTKISVPPKTTTRVKETLAQTLSLK